MPPDQQDKTPVADRAKGDQEAMSRLRIVQLSLVAVFAASMLMAAAASAAGPFWYTAGHVKLTQGSKGIKLQSKGPLTLHTTISTAEIDIICGRSFSDATIDGNGNNQGQGKGTVTYEQCKVEAVGPKECEVVQPIKTSQLKTHLVETNFQGNAKHMAELFEPATSQQTAEKIFAKITIKHCNPITFNVVEAPVKGTVVGVIEPNEQETQEGSLFFPTPAIKTIKHEGQEVSNIGLTFSTAAATFTGFYGARLQKGEVFGAFGV